MAANPPIERSQIARQYEAWGLLVSTSNVRPVHIANGLVQLLRLVDDPPRPLSGDNFAEEYVHEASRRLQDRGCRDLMPAVHSIAVTSSKRGPLLLFDDEHRADEPAYMESGRAHVKAHIREQRLGPEEQRLLAAVVNADNKVMESGAADPTTPGLNLAGYTSTHTLKGMHAATYLGLLVASESGREALVKLYQLLRSANDAQSRLLTALRLGDGRAWTPTLTPAALATKYPLPDGAGWIELAADAGRLTGNLLRWGEHGASKAEVLMAVVDLAALLLTLRLLRWEPPRSGAELRVLLCISPSQLRGELRTAIARAQQSLGAAASALDMWARATRLLERGGDDRREYLPSRHALNLGAGAGWCYPLNPQGGAKRYVRPGARQLTTLVHAMIAPGQSLSWSEFAEEAERLGLALGGPNEHRTERRLRIGAVSNTLRQVGAANREHLVGLGLARLESDNVIIIDGGVEA